VGSRAESLEVRGRSGQSLAEAESLLSIFIQKTGQKLRYLSDSSPQCPSQSASRCHDQTLPFVSGGGRPVHPCLDQPLVQISPNEWFSFSTSETYVVCIIAFVYRWLGTTVFRGMRNFELSHGICPFPWNFYIYAEFRRILYWLMTTGQMQHIAVGFRRP